VFLVLMVLAMIPAISLPPGLATLPAVLSVLFSVLSILSCFMMLVPLIQWTIVRHRHFAQMSPNDQAAARLSELRQRGAPDWWIGATRATKAKYVAAVLLLMVGVALIRPYPGSANFGLRELVFLTALAAVAVVSLRLRKKVTAFAALISRNSGGAWAEATQLRRAACRVRL